MPLPIDWARVLPVLVSIAVIILVAMVRNSSRTLAVYLATMPLQIPLSLWIASSGGADNQASMIALADGILLSLISLVVFTIIVWITAHLGWKVAPMILAGYIGWAVSALIILAARGLLK